MKKKTKPNQGWKYSSLIVAILAFSTKSLAYDFLVNGIYYKITNSTTHEVAVTLKSYTAGGKYDDPTYVSDYTGSVIIPSTVVNSGITYSVTGIDNHAFDDSDVTSITIPNTVKSIGESAFTYCIGLSSVVLPNSVTSIGDEAFSGCSGLTTISLPESVTTIGSSAFYGCSGLTKIQIPSSVTSFGSCIFTGSGIKESIMCGSMLLYCPPSYEGVYHTPMGTSEIAGGAFFGCTKITKVVIPHGVTRINSSTFQKCTSLEYVNIPSTLERVDESAFYGCSSLKECILPPTVTSIYKSAFYGCSSLESIVLPASLDVVWDYTFYNCPSLKTVVFPEGVTNIRLWGFGSTSEIEVYNFASCIQGHSEGPTGLYPSKIHVSEGFQGTPTSGTLVYDLESISSISISKTSLNMIEGEASSLSCNILPSTASVRALHWSSNNTDVVIVDSNGMVTAVGEGTATITVSTLDGSNLAQRCVVTVRDKINVGLIDGNAFGNTSAYLTNNLTYSRTYKNTNWQAWYVPFDVTLTSDVLAQFSFAKFAGTYTEDDGTFFISVARMREGDVVKANTPYLVQAKTAGAEAQVLTLTDATLYAAQEKGFSMNSAEKTVTIQGIYNTKTATDEDHEWYAFGGGKYIKASVGQMLSPYRFYMTITEREDNPYASTPNPTEVKIKVLGEDETGVAPLSVFTEEEKAAVYDLSGRRIEKKKATKGIYIINGKKIFVR